MVCKRCGWQNRKGDKYCAHCGARLGGSGSRVWLLSIPAIFLACVVLWLLFSSDDGGSVQWEPAPTPVPTASPVATATPTKIPTATPVRQPLTEEMLSTETNRTIFEHLAYTGTEYHREDGIRGLNPYVYNEFHLWRGDRYPLDEKGYAVVPKKDVLDYVYDTFGETCDQLDIPEGSADASTIQLIGDEYHIGGADGGDIREFSFEKAQNMDEGFTVHVRCGYESGDEPDTMYVLFVEEMPESANGFCVSAVTSYTEEETAQTEAPEQPQDPAFLTQDEFIADVEYVEYTLLGMSSDEIEGIFGAPVSRDDTMFISRYAAPELFDGSGEIEIQYFENHASTITWETPKTTYEWMSAFDGLEVVYGPVSGEKTEDGLSRMYWDFWEGGSGRYICEVQLIENPDAFNGNAYSIRWVAGQ